MRIKYIVTNYRYIAKYEYGVYNKINAQVDTFRKAGFDCEIDDCKSDYTLVHKVATRIPFLPDGIRWNSIDCGGFDCIYIRRPAFCSYNFIKWLRQTKKRYPNIRIILEFQTFPYDAEYYKLYRLPLLLKDILYRGHLKKYIDRAADLSNHDMIFGIKTIQIYNGIDLSSVDVRNPFFANDALNLLCVAVFNTWHGVDRILNGLADYKKQQGNRRVILHLVGEGQILKELKAQVVHLDLEDSVIFYGRMKPSDIVPLYNSCNMAIASLGLHRIGVLTASTLKTREYLAKGIPFVYSGIIDVFQEEPTDFCLQVPADDSPIEIQHLIDFNDRLYERDTPQELAKRIRTYAERHVSMDAAMANVVDYFKEECNG